MNELKRDIQQDTYAKKELESAVLNLTDLYVRKEYLNEIEEASVVPLNDILYKTLVPEQSMRLFHIQKISYSPETRISEKMKVIFDSLGQDNASAIFFVNGKKNHVDIYMGVCAQKAYKLSAPYALCHGAFHAVYPGSESERLSNNGNGELLKNLFPENEKMSIAALSGVALNDYQKNSATIEHLDSLVDAMKHKPFTMMVIAQPFNHAELVQKRRELENLYSEIYPYQKQDISLSRNESMSFGSNFSTSFTKSTSVSSGTSTSHSEGESEGTNEQMPSDTSEKEKSGARNTLIGMGMAAATAAILAAGGMTAAGEAVVNSADIASKALSTFFFGGNSMTNLVNSISNLRKTSETSEPVISHNQNQNINDTVAKSEQSTDGTAEGESKGISENESYTRGRTVQVSYVNKAVVDLLNLIDAQINELNEAEKTAMFHVGAYFIAGDDETAISTANLYRSIISSHGTVSRSPNIYLWSDVDTVSRMIEYLKRGLHPQFSFKNYGISLYPQMSIAQPVKSADMSAYFCLPEKTMRGINVIEHAMFPRDVIYRDKIQSNNDDEYVHIGNVVYMGMEDAEAPVTLPLNKLTNHMFVAGTTGTGKSNYCYQLIDTLIRKEKKILVIEPAKGEYAKVFGGRDGFEVYGTNINMSQLLRINPFAFPQGITVDEHIESLMDIFNNAWSMHSAMPAILKDALERVYEEHGFDLKYQGRTGKEIFPTFKDLLKMLPKVIKESEYSKEIQGNYTGALGTRIKSLTNGVYGNIFCCNEIGDEKLFDNNVIIDISRIRSAETKALIMGVLVNRLSEYRMCSGMMNSPLHHITLLEEAHHLLRKHSVSSGEGANMRGASVEMISNAIAEMRTYGEGFIIADQSPAIMDHSVIGNTQTKVFFMLPEREDRAVAASSLELTVNQQSELARLPIGVAVTYQNAWAEPVMTKINYFDKSLMRAYEYLPRNIVLDNKELFKQSLATLLYRRMTLENLSSSYDETKIEEILGKDYPWLGDVEGEFKRVLKDRERLKQTKNEASNIVALYSFIFDFEEQISTLSVDKATSNILLKEWLDKVKSQLLSSLELTDDEIDELIGLLIFSYKNMNRKYLSLYVEYKELSRK